MRQNALVTFDKRHIYLRRRKADFEVIIHKFMNAFLIKRAKNRAVQLGGNIFF